MSETPAAQTSPDTSPPPDAGTGDRLRQWFGAEPFVALVLALLIGLGGAYGAIAFREVYRAFQRVGFGTGADELYTHVAALPAWQVIAAPTLGGLMVGLFIRFALPGRRPQGVADVMESAALRAGRMDWRAWLGSALVNTASIGSGASVGREGPVVHLGAGIASFIAARLGLGRAQCVTMLGCGVAAAVSASFNAPIAGVFFALEVVIGHYALSAFAPIVIASVVGAIITRIHFGDFPAFVLPSHSITSVLEFPAFAILGVASALVAITFMRSIAVTRALSLKVPAPDWLRPAVGGLLVGLIALVFPNVLGVGYGTTDAAIRELLPFWTLIALLAAKTAATSICLGSGFGGGVFSPSLFLGAMLGGAFGIVATSIFPDQSSGHGAYTLVGMGAVAGCVLGAPISTILIIFELTGDYAITVAVMVGVVVASLITQNVHGKSFFHWQLGVRGITLTGGLEQSLLSAIKVRDLMRAEFATVPLGATMAQIRECLLEAPHGELFVTDDEGRPHGTITLADLSHSAFDTSNDPLLRASDVARANPPVVTVEDDLEAAIARMKEAGEEHLGVIDGAEDGKLVGFVHQVDVMLAYNRALLQARREERGED